MYNWKNLFIYLIILFFIQSMAYIYRAIFGYEGQTNNLKVVGSGNGGLQEMIEDLNSGEIMYAFCRVIDTKTSLPKCVLVNWQGEGAPIVRKGTCANHIRDIERLLKGAHITINARSEEDVEVDMIMEKLARATGSAYKFREPRGKDVGNSAPVGTTYKRVIPEQEINATERDRFWQREEMEEKARVAEERSRLEKERQRLELETRSSEEQRSKIREQQQQHQQQRAAAPTIIKQNEQSKSIERAQEIKNLRNQQIVVNQNGSDSDDEHKSRSDELRRQRSNETQQLIAQRTINARAVFEQNSSAGQMKTTAFNNHMANVSKSAAKEISPKVIEKIPESTPKEIINTPSLPVESLPKAEPIVELPKAAEPVLETQAAKIVNDNNAAESTQQTQDINNVETELYNQLSAEPYMYFDPNNEGMIARALYDYQAADDTEITFDPGNIITHIDAIDEGWWQGLGPDGTYGLFPANYVEVIDYGDT